MGGVPLGKVKGKAVITDANVLIDYAIANKNLFSDLLQFFHEVHVPVDILNEVDQLSIEEARRLGFTIYTPHLSIYSEAEHLDNDLSFQDRICFLEARKNNWAVVTNDRDLKDLCRKEDIETFWGLQVILMMVEEGLVTKKNALAYGEKIAQCNKWIKEDVIADFKKRIKVI